MDKPLAIMYGAMSLVGVVGLMVVAWITNGYDLLGIDNDTDAAHILMLTVTGGVCLAAFLRGMTGLADLFNP